MTMRQIISLLIFFTFLTSHGQVIIVTEDFYNIFKTGNYKNKSSDSALVRLTTKIIKPQTAVKSLDTNTAFIFPDVKGIILFKSRHSSRQSDVSGKLMEPSLIRIDTIFYNNAFQKDNSLFSFDVWFAVTINNKKYYTDFQPHYNIAFQAEIKGHQQLFLIYSQSQGYENYYDNGYPEKFHIVVLTIGQGLVTKYISDELPFEYGDEFWDTEGSMKSEYDFSKKELYIELNGTHPYKAIWTGQKLIRF